MKATMRFIGCAMAISLVPAMAAAQAKPAEPKLAPKPAMQHDMSMMGMDSGMKHDMSMMGKDSGMKHEAMSSGWKEFDAFHKALMDTWHPAEKSDLKPAREKAVDLVKAAEAWAASTGSAKCDNAATRAGLPGIVADAKAFGGVVRNAGTDDAVKAALKKTHDGFEKVAMPCMMEGMKGMKDMKKP
jgi:hypothetical protein